MFRWFSRLIRGEFCELYSQNDLSRVLLSPRFNSNSWFYDEKNIKQKSIIIVFIQKYDKTIQDRCCSDQFTAFDNDLSRVLLSPRFNSNSHSFDFFLNQNFFLFKLSNNYYKMMSKQKSTIRHNYLQKAVEVKIISINICFFNDRPTVLLSDITLSYSQTRK